MLCSVLSMKWSSICCRCSHNPPPDHTCLTSSETFIYQTKLKWIVCLTGDFCISLTVCVLFPFPKSYPPFLRSVTSRLPSLPPQASVLQQEKQGFINRIVSGTARFGKLQELIKVSSFIQPSLSQHSHLAWMPPFVLRISLIVAKM